MENINESGPSSPQGQNRQNNNIRFNKNRPYQKQERPFNDLRDVLNHKRQNNEKFGGPPSDPKYNYLSDPLRDGQSQTDDNMFGSGRISHGNQRFNSNRGNYNPGRGRGRGIFHDNFNKPQNKPGYSNYRETNDNYHQNSENFRQPREWDQNKDSQNRNFAPRYSNHKKLNNPHYFEPRQDYQNKFDNRHDGSGPSHYRQETQYRGPPHKFNPNFNRGGGYQKNYPRKNFNNKNVDPVNITIEYKVEDGSRKCTTQEKKLEKPWKKNFKKQKELKNNTITVEETEENWDEEIKTITQEKHEVKKCDLGEKDKSEQNDNLEQNENENLEEEEIEDLEEDVVIETLEEDIINETSDEDVVIETSEEDVNNTLEENKNENLEEEKNEKLEPKNENPQIDEDVETKKDTKTCDTEKTETKTCDTEKTEKKTCDTTEKNEKHVEEKNNDEAGK